MVALIIVDMQVGLFDRAPSRHDAEGVVGRINAVARAVRASGGIVIFIQHDGPSGDTFEPETAGWQIMPTLERGENDRVVHKRTCDAFCETDLSNILAQHGIRKILVTGCATDFCVDTTIRAAVSLDYDVVVVEDGHTTADRPHLDAVSIMRHHNWVWENIIHPRNQVAVLTAEKVVERMEKDLQSR